MRRIVMFVVLAAPLAFPATAHAFGCIGGGFGRSFTLGAGRSHRPFSFQIPEAGTLRVELDYSHVANPTAAIVVRLRRSTWKAAKTLIDSRRPNACRLAGDTITCLGARAHTAPGGYHLGVHKLSLGRRDRHHQRLLGGAAGRGGRHQRVVPAARRPDASPVRPRGGPDGHAAGAARVLGLRHRVRSSSSTCGDRTGRRR